MHMPYIERYLGGIVRVETTTKDEQEQAAIRTADFIDALAKKGPIFGIMGMLPDAIRRERVREVFVFGRLIHRATVMDRIS